MTKLTILSTADFESAVWTNKQHLAVRLAPHLDVTYVESLGLRTPRANASDAKRILARLGRTNSTTSSTLDAPLRLVKPRVIPLHAVPLVRALNRVSMKKQFGRTERERDRVLWTFSPLTYGIEDEHDYTIYHSVDLLHEVPGIPRATLLSAERELIRRADVVIASSTGVRQHLEIAGARDVLLWENVADTELFSAAQAKRRERVVFAGNLTASKVDFGLVRTVAETDVEVVLAGPRGIDGTDSATQLDGILKLPNVSYVGNLALGSLAQLFASCTVGIIPYLVNSYTTGVFPMKVYEYMAAGLAVVSTPLPSLMGRDEPLPHIAVAETNQFAGTVLNVLPIDLRAIDARKHDAETQSWSRRTTEALDLIGRLDAAR